MVKGGKMALHECTKRKKKKRHRVKRFNKPHERIDRKNLTLARLTARAIEKDPTLKGLTRAIERLERWKRDGVDSELNDLWLKILKTKDWHKIRHHLVSEGERGNQLRQGTPFIRELPPMTINKINIKYKRGKKKRTKKIGVFDDE